MTGRDGRQNSLNNLVNKLCYNQSTISCPPPVAPLLSTKRITAKIDSGASKHYFTKDAKHVLHNVHTITNGQSVSVPNGETISPDERGYLNLPHVSSHAKSTTIFPKLQQSLISVGQLCDDGCTATFSKNYVIVKQGHKTVMTGSRNISDGLWDLSFPINQTMNYIIEKGRTLKDLAQYHHASLFSPKPSTLHAAQNNNQLITFPGINSINFAKHMPTSVSTSKGHLDQERSGLQSTKSVGATTPPELELTVDEKADFYPERIENNTKTHECMALITPFKESEKAFMDSCGRFPHKSSRGNEYIMIVYDYDSNAILAEPFKNRTAGELKKTWEILHNRLSRNNIAPKLYLLDNEISNEFKNALIKYKLAFQLAPPYIHRQNAAERAIRTFKNHFISGLCSVHPSFPMSEWDRLLPQAELSLNLLRASRVNPKLSSYAFLFGNFDFNKTPLAPPGSKITVHLKPDHRATWDPHAENAWYVGPALDHYRCLRCYIPQSHRTRNADTVEFFPHHIPIPQYKIEDYIHRSLADIVAALQTKSTIPGLQIGDDIENATLEVARLLGRATKKPRFVPPAPLPPPSPSPPPLPSPSVPQTLPLPSASPPLRTPLPSPPVSIPRVQPARQSKTQLPQPVVVPRVPQPSLQDLLKQIRQAHRPSVQPTRLPRGSRHRHGTPFRHLATRFLTAQHVFAAPSANHIYDANGKKETIDSLLRGKDKDVWIKSLSNEFGRLAQGNKHGVRSTNTIDFIHKHEVPSGRDITYASFVCDYRPLKSEPYRVRIVVGGDKLSYPSDAASPATDLLETKILLNSVISDAHKGARFLSADLKDHFLASPMDRPEYMKIPISRMPDDIIDQYNLREKVDEAGYVWIKIKRGMYGLKQAAILAYDHLVNLLEPYGYYPEPHCVGMWSHKTRPTKFCLCVDDFGVKYFSKDDAEHLLNALCDHYKISVDWEGRNYCGLTIDWHYDKGYVDINMPGYVKKALHRFQHPAPKKPQYAPHRWTAPAYGKKVQFAHTDESPKLDKTGTKRVQSVSGTFLYYGRAMDPTLLVALSDISSNQTSPTALTKEECDWLMDYCHTYPDAKIRFYASDMILYCESDAAYLVLPLARSRIAAHYFLGNHPPKPPLLPDPKSTNGPIDTLVKRLRNVVASAAEAETAGTFYGSQRAIPMRRILHALGHKQPPDGTPFKMDNNVSFGFIKSNIKMKRSKTWDMRYHWLRDKATQKEFRYYWQKGALNNADYFTKNHPPSHHRQIRHTYILKGHLMKQHLLSSIQQSIRASIAPSHLSRRGCVETRGPRSTPRDDVSQLS